MSRNAASLVSNEEALYREMKLSQGGVMLLVRLQASLLAEPVTLLERLVAVPAEGDPRGMLTAGSRLFVTYEWLERQFGRLNANRALAEAAREVLEG